MIAGWPPAPRRDIVQLVYHYPGRRPLRALLILGLGFLLGWSACARHDPVIVRPMLDVPWYGLQ